MYEVKVESRGPEGIIGYSTFRITKKGSDELKRRMEEKKLTGAELLDGIDREPVEPAVKAAPQVGGPPLNPEAAKQ